MLFLCHMILTFFLVQMLPDLLRKRVHSENDAREISQASLVFPPYHCYAGEMAARLHSVPKPEGSTLAKPSAKYPTRAAERRAEFLRITTSYKHRKLEKRFTLITITTEP